MQKYIADDKKETEIQKNKELTAALNGLTNLDAEGAQNILQQTSDIAGADGGFTGNVELYNNGIENQGYAYRDGENNTIGFNTNKIDLTDSSEVIRNIFHETENFDAHIENEQTAINRGNTAAAIWELKNFGNANTNVLTNEQWNANNAGSAIFATGNSNAINNVKNAQQGNGKIAGAGGSIFPTSIAGDRGLGILETPIIQPDIQPYITPPVEPDTQPYITPPTEIKPEDMVETIPIEEQAPTVLADPITEYNPDDYILNASDGKEDKKPYSNNRPKLKPETVSETWDTAKQNSNDGVVRDPNTNEEILWVQGQSRKGIWDMGHTPENKYSDIHKKYINGEMTTQEFIQWYNDSQNYKPELPKNNRSHKYEQKKEDKK